MFYFNEFWLNGIAKRSPLDSLRHECASEHIADARIKRVRKCATRLLNIIRRQDGIAASRERSLALNFWNRVSKNSHTATHDFRKVMSP